MKATDESLTVAFNVPQCKSNYKSMLLTATKLMANQRSNTPTESINTIQNKRFLEDLNVRANMKYEKGFKK